VCHYLGEKTVFFPGGGMYTSKLHRTRLCKEVYISCVLTENLEWSTAFQQTYRFNILTPNVHSLLHGKDIIPCLTFSQKTNFHCHFASPFSLYIHSITYCNNIGRGKNKNKKYKTNHFNHIICTYTHLNHTHTFSNTTFL